MLQLEIAIKKDYTSEFLGDKAQGHRILRGKSTNIEITLKLDEG